MEAVARLRRDQIFREFRRILWGLPHRYVYQYWSMIHTPSFSNRLKMWRQLADIILWSVPSAAP